jgi:hypothetical protein
MRRVPMQRCKAKSKRSGEQCKNYAIKGYGVCRMHGARGGPKTIEGLVTCKKANLKHGFYSQESRKELRFMKELNSLSTHCELNQTIF